MGKKGSAKETAGRLTNRAARTIATVIDLGMRRGKVLINLQTINPPGTRAGFAGVLSATLKPPMLTWPSIGMLSHGIRKLGRVERDVHVQEEWDVIHDIQQPLTWQKTMQQHSCEAQHITTYIFVSSS